MDSYPKAASTSHNDTPPTPSTSPPNPNRTRNYFFEERRPQKVLSRRAQQRYEVYDSDGSDTASVASDIDSRLSHDRKVNFKQDDDSRDLRLQDTGKSGSNSTTRFNDTKSVSAASKYSKDSGYHSDPDAFHPGIASRQNSPSPPNSNQQRPIPQNNNGKIRLRVDASEPLSLAFDGETEGRTIQLVPNEDGTTELVIGGQPRGRSEAMYRTAARKPSRRKSVMLESESSEVSRRKVVHDCREPGCTRCKPKPRIRETTYNTSNSKVIQLAQTRRPGLSVAEGNGYRSVGYQLPHPPTPRPDGLYNLRAPSRFLPTYAHPYSSVFPHGAPPMDPYSLAPTHILRVNRAPLGSTKANLEFTFSHWGGYKRVVSQESSGRPQYFVEFEDVSAAIEARNGLDGFRGIYLSYVTHLPYGHGGQKRSDSMSGNPNHPTSAYEASIPQYSFLNSQIPTLAHTLPNPTPHPTPPSITSPGASQKRPSSRTRKQPLIIQQSPQLPSARYPIFGPSTLRPGSSETLDHCPIVQHSISQRHPSPQPQPRSAQLPARKPPLPSSSSSMLSNQRVQRREIEMRGSAQGMEILAKNYTERNVDESSPVQFMSARPQGPSVSEATPNMLKGPSVGSVNRSEKVQLQHPQRSKNIRETRHPTDQRVGSSVMSVEGADEEAQQMAHSITSATSERLRIRPKDIVTKKETRESQKAQVRDPESKTRIVETGPSTGGANDSLSIGETRSRIRTPQQIINERRARDARRKCEDKEQRDYEANKVSYKVSAMENERRDASHPRESKAKPKTKIGQRNRHEENEAPSTNSGFETTRDKEISPMQPFQRPRLNASQGLILRQKQVQRPPINTLGRSIFEQPPITPALKRFYEVVMAIQGILKLREVAKRLKKRSPTQSAEKRDASLADATSPASGQPVLVDPGKTEPSFLASAHAISGDGALRKRGKQLSTLMSANSIRHTEGSLAECLPVQVRRDQADINVLTVLKFASSPAKLSPTPLFMQQPFLDSEQPSILKESGKNLIQERPSLINPVSSSKHMTSPTNLPNNNSDGKRKLVETLLEESVDCDYTSEKLRTGRQASHDAAATPKFFMPIASTEFFDDGHSENTDLVGHDVKNTDAQSDEAPEEIEIGMKSALDTAMNVVKGLLLRELLDHALPEVTDALERSGSSSSGSNAGAASSCSSSNLSSRTSTSRLPTRKRMRGNGRDPGDGNDNDESDNDERPKKKNDRNLSDRSPHRRLKCPFYQREPDKYTKAACRGQGFADMAKLKDHIKRVHTQPLRCSRCWLEMKSDDAYSEHLQQDIACKKTIEPRDDRIRQQMLKRLDFKKTPYANARNVEEKWTMMFKVLFPNDTDIPSPCMSNHPW